MDFRIRRVNQHYHDVQVTAGPTTVDLGLHNDAERSALARKLRSAANDLHPESDHVAELAGLLEECRSFFDNCPSYDSGETNNLDTRCMDALSKATGQS